MNTVRVNSLQLGGDHQLAVTASSIGLVSVTGCGAAPELTPSAAGASTAADGGAGQLQQQAPILMPPMQTATQQPTVSPPPPAAPAAAAVAVDATPTPTGAQVAGLNLDSSNSGAGAVFVGQTPTLNTAVPNMPSNARLAAASVNQAALPAQAGLSIEAPSDSSSPAAVDPQLAAYAYGRQAVLPLQRQQLPPTVLLTQQQWQQQLQAGQGSPGLLPTAALMQPPLQRRKGIGAALSALSHLVSPHKQQLEALPPQPYAAAATYQQQQQQQQYAAAAQPAATYTQVQPLQFGAPAGLASAPALSAPVPAPTPHPAAEPEAYFYTYEYDAAAPVAAASGGRQLRQIEPQATNRVRQKTRRVDADASGVDALDTASHQQLTAAVAAAMFGSISMEGVVAYTWQPRILTEQTSTLTVPQAAVGPAEVQYRVQVRRTPQAPATLFQGQLHISNAGSSPLALAQVAVEAPAAGREAWAWVHAQCPAAIASKSGVVAIVPPRSQLTCAFELLYPGDAPALGTLAARIVTGYGSELSAKVHAFKRPAAASPQKQQLGACAFVSDSFLSPQQTHGVLLPSLKSGRKAPEGGMLVCDSATFSYSVAVDPSSQCGDFKVRLSC